jgi:hypothetical protein
MYGLLKESYVGAIFTNVYNTRDGNRNQVFRLDGAFWFTDFFRAAAMGLTTRPNFRGCPSTHTR